MTIGDGGSRFATAGSAPGRRKVMRRLLAATCLAAAGVGVGLGVAASAATGAAGLRTAAATTASVSRTLDVSGVLQPAEEATVAFQVAGTVAEVDVSQGQRVAAGQTLASLDPSDLQSQVAAAQAQLTAAQEKLSSDESAQTATVASGSSSGPVTAASTGTGGGAAGPSAGAGSGSRSSGSSGSSIPGIAGDQQSIVTLQQSADGDLAAARADLAAAETACSGTGGTGTGAGGTGTGTGGTGGRGAGGQPPGTTTTTVEPTTTTTTTTAEPTTTTTTARNGNGGGGAGSSSEACAAALSRAEADEVRIATVQKALAAAEGTLAQALAAAERAQPSPTGAGSTRPTSPSAPAASTDSPAQLASDQAAIDSDEASLVEAQQSLAAATLTSPLAGTVASVGITAGQYVPAASTTATITVIGSGAYQTTAELTTTQVQGVKVGDTAQVSVDGVTGTFGGVVSTIGPVQVGSTGSYTYPVVVAISSPGGQMAAGSATSVQIALERASGVLAVPTSAVHTTAAGDSFVYVDQNGKEVQRKVRVGLVGPVYTQIESGIGVGETVVLADASLPVPASSTNPSALRGLAGLGRGNRAFFGGGAAGTARRTAPGG